MSTYPPSGSGGFGRRLEEAMNLIETELRQAVAHMNDSVVPQVRRESIAAMRAMSDRLRELADRLEVTTPPPPAGEGTATPGPAKPEKDSRI